MRAGYGLLLAALLPGAALAQVTDTASYLQRMDSDGDGRVSEAEYVQWMLYAFDRMDRNGDGVLTAEELLALVPQVRLLEGPEWAELGLEARGDWVLSTFLL